MTTPDDDPAIGPSSGGSRELSPTDAPVVRRRRVLRTGATLLAGAAAGVAATGGTMEYDAEHPSPNARVSPLVQAGVIHSPRIVWRGDGRTRRVALTFDDGPDPRWTPLALEVLKKYGARATFFMLGSFVALNPALARTVTEAGHEVGNHGWDHRHMSILPPAELALSLGRSHQQIAEATGTAPRLMRPPYGQFDAATAWAIAQLDYPIVLWSHRMTADDPTARARENIATAVGGMIMLSHDGRSTPTLPQLAATDWMIGQMQQQGWEFVTVSDLLA